MADTIRVGIIGAGWPGSAHAKGYQQAGGYKSVAVADLIPQRRKSLMGEFGLTAEYADWAELLADPKIDLVSVCLPTDLHVTACLAALRKGKHVICEMPPALNAAEAKRMESTAAKSGKMMLYAAQRRFGAAEQAAHQAIAKGYAGEIYHARASWTRTRGIPIGTGWFTDGSRSGGGALIDLGAHMLDLAWYLMGEPVPQSVFAVGHRKFQSLTPAEMKNDVEDSAFAIVRFEGGKSLELACSWAINQPPNQNGTACRIYGDQGAVEVYTPRGPILYRGFEPNGRAKEIQLKQPKSGGHMALMRHARDCMIRGAVPISGPAMGVGLMRMIDAMYKSAATGKSVSLL
ncbi:MAG: Gfo/Idh/MocA family oxidoreductase [Phycisphaerales bacterium]|jgi:predicted dehydrogenase|nr:Gfo/Idh/MocA family oxidoreductase [Phycisphaerales bacterium]